jgi:hypothetical protein
MKWAITTVTLVALMGTLSHARNYIIVDEWARPFCHRQVERCDKYCTGPFCAQDCEDYFEACRKNHVFVTWGPDWWGRWQNYLYEKDPKHKHHWAHRHMESHPKKRHRHHRHYYPYHHYSEHEYYY